MPAPLDHPWIPRVSRTLASAALAVLAAASPAAANDPIAPALSLLERQYLFEDQLVPATLLDKAIEAYARDVGDLDTRRADDSTWLLATPDCQLRLALEPGATIAALAEPLARIGSFLESCSLALPEEMPAMPTFLLGGLLGGLDPYTTVFDEKRQAEHNIQFLGKLAGIGARIGIRRDELTLLTVYPDSPAARAGLRDGDTVLRIDDLSTKNILVSDAVERIRGEEGSRVTLTIRREAEPQPRAVTVTRGIVVIPTVTSRLLSGDVLYVEITQFSQTTPHDFRREVEEALEETDLRGVVIDLRKNSGGSMLGSSDIGRLFLPEGLLITTAGRDAGAARGITPEIRANGDAPFRDLAVVFLTGPRTASGSELLAASLGNNDRALIVGEPTFGKGTIQKTYPLSESSSLKMTVGRFLPVGHPLPGTGLVPDIEVLALKLGKRRSLLPFPAHRADLPFWLRKPSWATVESRAQAYRLAFAEEMPAGDDVAEPEAPAEEPEEEDPALRDGAPDRTLEIAAAVVRNFGRVSAAEMLAGAREFLDRTAATAEADLVDFMYERGLDWTDGPRPRIESDFDLEVRPSGDLVGAEETDVEVRLTNRSDAPFYRVRGYLESNVGGLAGRALAFGRIGPGATRAWTMRVKIPATARTGPARAVAVLFDDDGEIGETAPVRLVVGAAPRPHLAFRTRVEADAKDPALLSLHVDLENRAEAAASDVDVRLRHPLDERFEIIDGYQQRDRLEGGGSSALLFRARLLGSYAEAPVAELSFLERGHGIFFTAEVPLAAEEGEDRGWRMPPRVEVDALAQNDDGTYVARVSASDDRRLIRVRARVGERTEAYIEPSLAQPNRAVFEIPWNPDAEVERLRIEAVDDDGMRDFYSSGW